MSLHGLPTKTKVVTRQRTVNGIKYAVVTKSYYGTHAGFTMRKIVDGETATERFHNGKHFKDPFSIDEALDWAVENL